MIRNKSDLIEYLYRDMTFYYSQSKKDRFLYWITNDPIWHIARYIRLLRKEEYYHNVGKGKGSTLIYLNILRKKNKLGNRLGIKIPKNCFGPGLTIYHHGEIIVNENARIGANCVLHGGNCIGNNGKEDKSPIIGEGLDLGFGAQIIGNIKLGNGVRVGANAVVTKSFSDDDIVLIGVPADRKVKESSCEYN